MEFLRAFLVGGFLCAIAQFLIDKFRLTPARILVIYVTSGVFLTVAGLYQPLVDFAGCGATVPLTGFGYTLAKGAAKGVEEFGVWGIFSGGTAGSAAGIAAAVVFGFLAALLFKPKSKN
ncbi:MAG: stage V sporulation protein AE [Clostridia bacterium]|nr:stage V sporulation protein AE [Clostridia bacterium]